MMKGWEEYDYNVSVKDPLLIVSEHFEDLKKGIIPEGEESNICNNIIAYANRIAVDAINDYRRMYTIAILYMSDKRFQTYALYNQIMFLSGTCFVVCDDKLKNILIDILEQDADYGYMLSLEDDIRKLNEIGLQVDISKVPKNIPDFLRPRNIVENHSIRAGLHPYTVSEEMLKEFN